MRFLAIFLFCLPCFAQFPYSGVAWKSATSSAPPGPATFPGMDLYWVASDLPVGPKVSSWVDRIQGKLWTNGNSSTQPTNSALGIYFDGSNGVLTNDGSWAMLTAGPPCTWWVVLKPVENGKSSTRRPFINAVVNVSQNGKGFYWFDAKVSTLNAQAILPGVTNNMIDWMINQGNDATHWVTNGVYQSVDFTLKLQSASDWNGLNLAQNPSFGHGWFYLAELGRYTNDCSTNTTIQAALHLYATNTYSYSP